MKITEENIMHKKTTLHVFIWNSSCYAPCFDRVDFVILIRNSTGRNILFRGIMLYFVGLARQIFAFIPYESRFKGVLGKDVLRIRSTHQLMDFNSTQFIKYRLDWVEKSLTHEIWFRLWVWKFSTHITQSNPLIRSW